MPVRPIFQHVADLVGNLFRLIPRAARFALACRLARLLAPLLRYSPYYRRRPSLLDGSREEALRMLLRSMARVGVEFEVDPVYAGEEHVPPGPAIFVSAHFLLNVVITRWAHDAGRRLTPILGGPREPIYRLGTRLRVQPILAGPHVLLQARACLQQGDSVFVDLDNTEPSGRALRVETDAGPRFVSDAMLRFAAAHGTPVVFVATHFGRHGGVEMRFSPLPWRDASAAREEFVRLFVAHVAQVRR